MDVCVCVCTFYVLFHLFRIIVAIKSNDISFFLQFLFSTCHSFYSILRFDLWKRDFLFLSFFFQSIFSRFHWLPLRLLAVITICTLGIVLSSVVVLFQKIITLTAYLLVCRIMWTVHVYFPLSIRLFDFNCIQQRLMESVKLTIEIANRGYDNDED